MSNVLPLAICHPGQCCNGYCIDEIYLHGVTRAVAEDVAEAVGHLIDRALHPEPPPDPKPTARPPHPNTMAGRK